MHHSAHLGGFQALALPVQVNAACQHASCKRHGRTARSACALCSTDSCVQHSLKNASGSLRKGCFGLVSEGLLDMPALQLDAPVQVGAASVTDPAFTSPLRTA